MPRAPRVVVAKSQKAPATILCNGYPTHSGRIQPNEALGGVVNSTFVSQSIFNNSVVKPEVEATANRQLECGGVVQHRPWNRQGLDKVFSSFFSRCTARITARHFRSFNFFSNVSRYFLIFVLMHNQKLFWLCIRTGTDCPQSSRIATYNH